MNHDENNTFPRLLKQFVQRFIQRAINGLSLHAWLLSTASENRQLALSFRCQAEGSDEIQVAIDNNSLNV